MISDLQLVGSSEEGSNAVGVLVVRVSGGDRREYEDWKLNGGGIRLTVVSLGCPLYGERQAVEVSRVGNVSDGLVERPAEVI